jgi:DNA mismatch repair protein MutS
VDLTQFIKEEPKEAEQKQRDSATDYAALSPDKLTPGMRQFVEVKKQHPDCLVLFRMGDFYETFYDDAKLVSRELDIVLTARGAGEKRAPLAGIPYHSLEQYLAKLVKRGYKVAIVEQLEDPKKAKGLVKRGVVRIVTPGTIIESGMLDAGSHNYLMALYVHDSQLSFALCDISTGEFLVGESSVEQLAHHLARFAPAECVIPHSLAVNAELLGLLQTHKVFVNPVEDRTFQRECAVTALSEHFHTFGVDGFGLDGMLVQPAGALLNYIMETQKVMLKSINSVRTLNLSSTMLLDGNTLRNLELLRNSRDGSMKATLLSVIDKTKTSMGSRLLRSWVKEPLLDVGRVNERLDAVGWLKDNTLKRAEIVGMLSSLHDVQRLIGRVAFGAANARDLLALKLSLRMVPGIAAAVSGANALLLKTISSMPHAPEVVELIEHSILDEPSAVLNEGNLIKHGYDLELDKLHDVRKNSKLIIKGIEDREKARTGIRTLRVGFNNVFGYYIEVSKSYIPQVPSDYIRKQTTANGERYVTQELKEQEELILHAEEKICTLEFDLFQAIVGHVGGYTPVVQDIASRLALLDVLCSLAVCAADYRYRRPVVNDSGEIVLVGSRHPVLEQIERGFVANDVRLDGNEMMVITGPNMAGKSTFMRQVALIVLMAQMGSFVPADEAQIGVVDRIFTRVGATDDLSTGQSTFMMEMNETASILHNATSKSLIILDEIGRGTSTFDGVSIAWSVAEHIATSVKAKTLFATHYHVMNKLADSQVNVSNYTVAVKEDGHDVIFLHKIIKGSTDKSYGIHVARLAGLPANVISRALELQKKFESEDGMRSNLGS